MFFKSKYIFFKSKNRSQSGGDLNIKNILFLFLSENKSPSGGLLGFICLTKSKSKNRSLLIHGGGLSNCWSLQFTKIVHHSCILFATTLSVSLSLARHSLVLQTKHGCSTKVYFIFEEENRNGDSLVSLSLNSNTRSGACSNQTQS